MKYLTGLYSYIPEMGSPRANPALFSGDEIGYADYMGSYIDAWNIAEGEQNISNPIINYFSSVQTGEGLRDGNYMFTAIRDCNIFLENISHPYDLEAWERDWWIGDVKFLKAFYHFWLFRMYGPIPLIRENISVGGSAAVVQSYRATVDECVDYIASLCDEAAELLPLTIDNTVRDLGRPTRVVALAIKAQLLTLAASPLFNGNTDYADYKDNRGVTLFPQTYEPEKWVRAADALKAAIDAAHEAEISLYDFRTAASSIVYAQNLCDEQIYAMQTRGAMTEKWNVELVWGDTRSQDGWQNMCMPAFFNEHLGGGIARCYSPSLRTVEQFYTKNGIPIEDDASWQGLDLFAMRTATADDRQYIRQDQQTIQLHFDREPRFYGSICFDRGTFYGNSRQNIDNTSNPNNMYVTTCSFAFILGRRENHPVTGYLCKKRIHFLSVLPDNSYSLSRFASNFPIIRLADLYLMYAEALNEVKEAPDAEVYEYIDIVRKRSGLKGVVESWNSYAIPALKQKPATKDGFRQIVHRERLNELAFEGPRFWDLRRWKEAEEYMNGKYIRGLTPNQEGSQDEFYKVRELTLQTFEKKHYFWPIKENTILKDQNLLQSPGW
jgi:hypothetical protein